MSVFKAYVEFYARPSTQELFGLEWRILTYSQDDYCVGEDITIYLEDMFWSDYKSKMYQKSIYKFAGILEIEYITYQTYDGVEHDCQVHVDRQLLLERAHDFHELSNTLSSAGILSKPRYRTRKGAFAPFPTLALDLIKSKT